MASTARELKNDATAVVPFKIVLDNVVSLSGDVPITKIMLGAEGVDGGYISSTLGVPSNTVQVAGTAVSVNAGNVDAGTQRVVLASDQAVLSIDDNGASITIDNAALTVTGGGVEATALRVTIASDSTGVVTVDGTITANAGTGFAPIVTDGSTVGTTGTHILGTDGTNAQIISTNATGHINIADGGNVITVDGTVIANAGTGTFTVDGSAVIQPISAASLPLPAGAATLAAQLADGHNVTVDNAAAGAAVNIQDGGNTITVDNGGTFAVQDATVATNTTNVPNVIGTDGTAGPSRTLSVGGTESGGNIQEVRVDGDGHLQIDVLTGGGGGDAVHRRRRRRGEPHRYKSGHDPPGRACRIDHRRRRCGRAAGNRLRRGIRSDPRFVR